MRERQVVRHNELNEAKLITREYMSEEGHYSWNHDRHFYSLKQVRIPPTHTHTQNTTFTIFQILNPTCLYLLLLLFDSAKPGNLILHTLDTYFHAVCVGADDEHLAP